jgi:hypothetical protein
VALDIVPGMPRSWWILIFRSTLRVLINWHFYIYKCRHVHILLLSKGPFKRSFYKVLLCIRSFYV